jgi:phosphatidate cytidylyltransferase
MLKYRLIVGTTLTLALLGVILLDDWVERHVRLEGPWSRLFLGRDDLPKGVVLFALGLLVAAVAARELSDIAAAQRIRTSRWLTALAAMLGLVLSYSVPMGTKPVTAIAIVATGLVVMFVISLLTFSHERNVEGVLAAAGAVMFSMVYLGFMFGFLLALRREHSAWWIVGVVVVTKSCDSGAYFTGRTIGRHKLIPWLSPGKTWEGLIGGIVFAALVGLLTAWASRWLPDEADHVAPALGLLLGVVFALVGQFGDLTMSLLKRGAGLKDSSHLLPGLGGVLDVLDSPLMVAPVAFWMLELAG